MKKLFTFILLCLSLVACSVDGPFEDDARLTSLTGNLELEKGSNGRGEAYILTDKEGVETALVSLSIDLSKSEYVGNSVEVSGFLREDDNVFEVTGISVLEVNKSEPEPGVLTEFSSTENGFQMSYFDDWEIDESEGNVEFSFSQEDKLIAKVTVELRPYVYLEPSADVVAQEGAQERAVQEDSGVVKAALEDFFKDDQSAQSGKWVKVGADGYDALNEGDTYYFYRYGHVYNVSFVSVDRENVIIEDLQRKFLTMIGTFKFVAFKAAEESESVESNTEVEVSTYEGEMTPFASLPYSFRGEYPKSWYYAGSKSGENGVLHHYGFSEESVSQDNEIIALEVLSTPLPSGKSISYGGKSFVMQDGGVDNVTFYFSAGDKTFRISGPNDLVDLVIAIAVSVEEIDLQPAG